MRIFSHMFQLFNITKMISFTFRYLSGFPKINEHNLITSTLEEKDCATSNIMLLHFVIVQDLSFFMEVMNGLQQLRS